jgi:hypothetical protein
MKRRSQRGRRSWNGMIEHFLCFKLSTLMSLERKQSTKSRKNLQSRLLFGGDDFFFPFYDDNEEFTRVFRVVSLRNVFLCREEGD